MRRILGLILIGVMMCSSAHAITWTKSWSSADDGSSFGGSDIQNIQNDIGTQVPTLSGTNAFIGQNSFTYFPTTPSSAPTTDYQVANKKYVDDNGSSVIVQVVNTQTGAVSTGSTASTFDDSIPQVSECDLYTALNTAVTPTSATNKLKIEVTFCCALSGAGVVMVGLFQDSDAAALAAVEHRVESANGAAVITFTHYMTSGTTSATTFKVGAGCSGGGTLTFNGSAGGRIFGGVMASSVTITEISV